MGRHKKQKILPTEIPSKTSTEKSNSSDEVKQVVRQVATSETLDTSGSYPITEKCDIERCKNQAVIFLNVKYCLQCAKDKGFA
jgi:hypothetical protein